MSTIPVIDLAPLGAGSPAEKRRLGKAVIEAAQRFGFFYISNHGIPSTVIKCAYAEARTFFALPLKEKQALSNTLSNNMRGYVGFREETPENSDVGDNKEGFDMAVDYPADHPLSRAYQGLYGPNVWPPRLPGFEPAMTLYHQCQLDLAQRLLGCFAVGLDLAPDYFQRFIAHPLAQLRILHYPPASSSCPELSVGCGAHTDYGTLTILSQDSEGLEIMNPDGGWITARPVPGTLIVNVGDLMARWTNDRLFANTHRVINRQATDRYSIAFFLDPDYEAEIACLPSCLGRGETPLYPPVTFGHYNEEKLNATFTFRKTAR